MSVDPHERMPTHEIVGLLAFVLLIAFPAYLLYREGGIFLFGDSPLLYLYAYSLSGGAICGLAFGKNRRFLGLLSGVVSAAGGTSVFLYYALYPVAIDTLSTIELLIALLIGALPGFGLFVLGDRIARHFYQKNT